MLEVADEAASNTLLASLPLLDRLLGEKIAAVRERRMEEMVDFMAALACSPQALSNWRWRSGSPSATPASSMSSASSAPNNWPMPTACKPAIARPWPTTGASVARCSPWATRTTRRERDIYPAFQFENGKPIKAVQEVLEAFGGRKALLVPALWFTSNNGGLPGSARPVDLLASDPDAAVQAKRGDAEGSAA